MFKRIDFKLTAQEWADFNRARLAYRVGGKYTRTLAILLGIIFTIVGFSVFLSQPFGGILCVVIGTFLFVRGFGMLSSPYPWAIQMNNSTTHVTLANDEIIVYNTVQGASHIKAYSWQAIEDVFPNPTGVLLAFYGEGEVWIPSTAFSSEEDRNQFLGSVSALVQEVSRTRSPAMRVLVSIARFLGK